MYRERETHYIYIYTHNMSLVVVGRQRHVVVGVPGGAPDLSALVDLRGDDDNIRNTNNK